MNCTDLNTLYVSLTDLSAMCRDLEIRVKSLEQKIDNTPKEREEGYYWVKHQSLEGWEPANLFRTYPSRAWEVIGNESMFLDDELIEIGPRIHPPEE